MKAGKIGEDGESGFALNGSGHEVVHGAEEGGQVFEDFGDAYDGHSFVVQDHFNTSGAHERATHAEEMDIEALFQGGGEMSRVHVAGGFTCGKE